MIMCKTHTSPEGIRIEVPIADILKHKADLGDDNNKIADTVGDLVCAAAVKGTFMILENNWHDLKSE